MGKAEDWLYSVGGRVFIILLLLLTGFWLAMKWWMIQDASTIQTLIHHMFGDRLSGITFTPFGIKTQ